MKEKTKRRDKLFKLDVNGTLSDLPEVMMGILADMKQEREGAKGK